jgi:hypothetical protein
LKLSLTHVEEEYSCELTLHVSHSFEGNAEALKAYLANPALEEEILALFTVRDRTVTVSYDEWEKFLDDACCESFYVQRVNDGGVEELRFGTGPVTIEAYNDAEKDKIDVELDFVVSAIKKIFCNTDCWKTSLTSGGENWVVDGAVVSAGYATC